MSIIGRSLWANRAGLRVVDLDGLTFAARVPIAEGTHPPLTATDDLVTVDTNGQTLFTLATPPEPGAIPAVLKDGLVYFEPSFRLADGKLVWQGAQLGAGETFRVVSFGGGLAAGHMRLEKVTITQNDQRRLVLDGTPVGPHTIVYHNGKAYPVASGHARTTNNVVDWLDPLVKLNIGDQVYVYYARTLEAANDLVTQTFPLNVTSSHILELSTAPTPPENTVLMLDDTRYTYGVDFTVTGPYLIVDSGLPFKNGLTATVQFTRTGELTIVPGSGNDQDGGTTPPPPSGLPAIFFSRSTVDVTANGQTALSLANAPTVAGKSIAAVDGLVYVEGHGYTRSGAAVTWNDPDLALKGGDKFQLFGFAASVIGNAIAIRELTGFAGGNPTFDLTEPASGIAKTLLVVSAAGTNGGLIFSGDQLAFPDNSHVAWAGPMPIKTTDRVFAIYFKSADVANAMRLEHHVVTAGEAGPAFSTDLAATPGEGANLFVIFNGSLLALGQNFSLAGKTFTYTGGPVTEGDRFAFLYH
jgi:hypothetical protein